MSSPIGSALPRGLPHAPDPPGRGAGVAGARVLLTGANGFVGSHVLDRLRAEGWAVSVLLRPSSDTRFIRPHLSEVTVRPGRLDDPASLRAALEGVTHVLHCAGATKALTEEELFRANQVGTRHLVQAAKEAGSQIRRFVLISSLAAGRPGTRAEPAEETALPAPLSAYGRSKLAGEREVTTGGGGEFTVLRPGGVYGPRDREFLRLFRAAGAGVLPVFGGGRQELSLVYAADLAEVAVQVLTAPGAAGQTLNVAGADVVTAGELLAAVAATLGTRPWRLPLPRATLKLICGGSAIWASLTRRATVLALGKWRELTAPGWVADLRRLEAVLGPVCRTRLSAGLDLTRAWFQEQGWLGGAATGRA